MGILTKDEIMSKDDLKRITVKVPEWGGSVIVRTLMGDERDEFENSIIQGGDKRDYRSIRAKLIALSIIGEDGKRLFTFAEASKLGEKSASALDRIFAVAQRLSGLSNKDMDEISNDFTEGRSDGSTSG